MWNMLNDLFKNKVYFKQTIIFNDKEVLPDSEEGKKVLSATKLMEDAFKKMENAFKKIFN